jgi:hypothetical protein
MLIIGGVAVPLATLPDWAQHVSAFFPGRYAVQAIQACVAGNGLGSVAFSLLALTLIGGAGAVAGARMFRWDAQQRFAALAGKGWIAVALAAWVAVGLLAESRGHIATAPGRSDQAGVSAGSVAPRPVESSTPSPRIAPPEMSAAESASSRGRSESGPAAGAAPSGARAALPPPPSPWPPVPSSGPTSWQSVTIEDIDRDLLFNHLPADSGIISPIARPDDLPDPEVETALERLRQGLQLWAPGKVADPVQRTRNYLYILAIPDIFQRPLERFAPRVVFDRLQREIPNDDLIKILYWIAMHPEGGDDAAVGQLQPLGIEDAPDDTEQTRERVVLYGVKLLGRLLGRIRP